MGTDIKLLTEPRGDDLHSWSDPRVEEDDEPLSGAAGRTMADVYREHGIRPATEAELKEFERQYGPEDASVALG